MRTERPTARNVAPILVVDDERPVREWLRAGLQHLGYPVETAADAAEARALLRTRAFSMLLCDYEMPGGSGLELLAHVTRVHPDLPCILLTGHDETALARRAIHSGAADFLAKPMPLRQLARAIEQNWSRQERERERAAALTQEVLAGTIRALVAAIDAKDPHTACHSERVARLALCLGQAVGLPEERLRVLEFSALLHDVGKIAVPEEVLRKPGALSEAERRLMRQHPVRSAEIVSQVAPLQEVATIVRHHHERVDGRGYPDGLAGEAIPPLARLLAIADAYEAMTSDRAYRARRSPAAARDVLAAELGQQFDRTFGEAFLALEALP